MSAGAYTVIYLPCRWHVLDLAWAFRCLVSPHCRIAALPLIGQWRPIGERRSVTARRLGGWRLPARGAMEGNNPCARLPASSTKPLQSRAGWFILAHLGATIQGAISAATWKLETVGSCRSPALSSACSAGSERSALVCCL